MKAYKGFDKELKCRGFHYEIGKTYTMPKGETLGLCGKGFHACTNIIDCLSYYPPSTSRYCEVEIDGVTSEKDVDSKRVAKTITIIKELTLNELHDISQQQYNIVSGGNGSSVSGGDWSSVSGGNWSSVSGGYRSSVSGGDWSSVRGGDWSSVRGGYGSSVSGGYGSSVSGGYGSSVRGGYGSSVRGGDMSSVSGGERSSVRGGYGSRFKGKKDCVFVAEYYKDNTLFVGMRVAVVDGLEFLPDKWYELYADGNWKEAENQQD